MSIVHKVYWTLSGVPQSKDFTSAEMTDSLKFCESLRKARIAGEPISFISMASEIPECVSLSGVSEPDSDYVWEKRRGGRK